VVRVAAGVGAAAGRPNERGRLQHAVEALVDDRLPQRLRRRRQGSDRGAKGLPADGGNGPTGVRAARVCRGVGRRGARRANAGAVRA
jgi:hypothetical protein